MNQSITWKNSANAAPYHLHPRQHPLVNGSAVHSRIPILHSSRDLWKHCHLHQIDETVLEEDSLDGLYEGGAGGGLTGVLRVPVVH